MAEFKMASDGQTHVIIIGGACDPDLSRGSDLRVTWKNGGLALFTKSRVDSHHTHIITGTLY
jgi:hypothetical protein